MAGILDLFSVMSNILSVCLTGTINAPEASTSLKEQHFNVQKVC